MIPSKEEFPYTIRVVSEIMSSNGSSSQATICASALSLMDAGVPLKKPAAGIAMGLMMAFNADGTADVNNYKVLTDIQGPEDHHGDMDLKVAGTDDGVTGMQMDVKVDGLTIELLEKAFAQARDARIHILKTIKATLPAHRDDDLAVCAEDPPVQDRPGKDRHGHRSWWQDDQRPYRKVRAGRH